MRVTHVSASNWRNFRNLSFNIERRLYVVGPNASGKSNLLDIFRFLRDIAMEGGGLSHAVWQRGGLHKIRSLFSRGHNAGAVSIEIGLANGDESWRYRLSIASDVNDRGQVFLTEEIVEHNNVIILSRPDDNDIDDPLRMTQTHLEQIGWNKDFRVLADFLASVRYFHPVPQIIREPASVGVDAGRDYGASLIEEMGNISDAIVAQTGMASIRKRLVEALRSAIPDFSFMDVRQDFSGRTHLMMHSEKWDEVPFTSSEDPRAFLDESDISDGTLRLIGLLWPIVTAQTEGGVYLLEEPEISLNNAIVRQIPRILAVAQRDHDMQTIISTHATSMLDDDDIRSEEVLILRPTELGTVAHLLSEISATFGEVTSGLPLSDIIGFLIDPTDLSSLEVSGGAITRD